MINLKSIESLLCEEMDLKDISLSLSVDNRKISEKDIFIAIVGEKYNPLSHLGQVINSGCKYIIYEKNSSSDEQILNFKNKITFLPVTDLIKTIGLLGGLVASEFRARGGKIIGISGSNGKTTTKEMLFHILCESFGDSKVICTQKNNNNHLGVPFTLFQISNSTKFAIVELGSNAPGEIEYLCKMINANIGVTTNIGDTHLEFFDTRENVFKEEAVLSHYCLDAFFINGDDEYLSQIPIDPKKVSFGSSGKNYKFVFSKGGVEVNNHGLFNFQITGTHNFQNLALAFSIANYLNPLQTDQYIKAAKSFRPTANRSEWIKIREVPTFLDAYNANPSSMKVALEGFSSFIESNGSKNSEACVILGDMNELGQNSGAMHKEVGEYCLKMGFRQYIFVGSFCEQYTELTQGNISKLRTTEEAKNFLSSRLEDFKYLFIKGSRSLQLERITDIK